MKQWYALHTKPNSEYRVVAGLQQREIETYLPEVNLPQSGKARQSVPFFPCYLFMRVDMGKMRTAQWQWTPGLRRVVSIGNEPTPIPDQVILLIKDKLDEINETGSFPSQPYKAGDTVRITKGPLAGMLAIFEKPTSSRRRVQVLLNFLGRINRVKVEPHDLEKAPSHVRPSRPKNRRRSRGRGRPINK